MEESKIMERLQNSIAFKKGLGVEQEDVMQETSAVDGIVEDTQDIVADDVKVDDSHVENEQTALMVANQNDVHAITDLGLKDIKVKIDNTKSTSSQIKDVVDIAATVKAVQDEDTTDRIAVHKKEELVYEAETKAKGAAKESVKADSEVQKAKREKYKLLFDTFGVADHIPDWLLKALMFIFAPFYVVFVVVIGIPTGFVRFLIDCIDGILCRYDKIDGQNKPHIKVTVWVILALLIVVAVCLTTLKCLHII